MRRIIVVIFIPVYLILSIPFLLLTYVANMFNRDLTRRMAYMFCRSYAVLLLKLMGAKIEITGLEHLDDQRNYLFVCNHQSLLDSPALMILSKKPLSFISKMEMKKTPLLASWMSLLGCLFLNRSSNREGLKTILQGIEQMKLGDNIAVFPQGTRSKDGNFLPFKAGSLKLATKADAPILPIAIAGTDEVFGNNGLRVKPGTIHLHVFPPIETKGLSMEEQKNLSDEVSTLIHDQFMVISQGP